VDTALQKVLCQTVIVKYLIICHLPF
jgi:hypothetical protein